MPSKQVKFINVQGSKGLIGLPKSKKINAKFPRAKKSGTKLRSDLSKWKKAQKSPKSASKLAKIKGVKMDVRKYDKLTKIHLNPHSIGEISAGQKLKHEDVIGMVSSSLLTLEYHKMKGEYLKELKKARSVAQKAKVRTQWASLQKAAIKAYAQSGVKNIKTRDLEVLSKSLRKKKTNYNTIITIANTAKTISTSSSNNISTFIGGFVVQTGVFVAKDVFSDFTDLVTGFCDTPIEGSYTKHFSKSFSLKVTLTVWCPTFWKPWKTCKKTFTLASLSFNASVGIGYRVTCCGGAAWGQASARVCASLFTLKYCAGCTATIMGVVGVGRASGSGSSCTYGLGLSANLKCTFAGITVLNVTVPFGWTISAPCPPAILPC